MKHWIWIPITLLFAPLIGGGATVEIEGASIEIPAPDGFVEVNAETPELGRFLRTMVPPSNVYLAAFVSPEVFATAKAGPFEAERRYFSAQGLKDLPVVNVTATDFAELRELLVSQNDELMKELRRQMPDALDGLEGNVNGEYNVDAAFELSSMIPLEPHLSAERALAFSMLVKMDVAVPGEEIEEHGVVTVGLVRAQDRIVYVYAFGGAEDLDWSREQNTAWIADVLKANGVAEEDVFREPVTKAPGSGFKLPRIVIWALVGGVAGGIVALVNRKKQQT